MLIIYRGCDSGKLSFAKFHIVLNVLTLELYNGFYLAVMVFFFFFFAFLSVNVQFSIK